MIFNQNLFMVIPFVFYVARNKRWPNVGHLLS